MLFSFLATSKLSIASPVAQTVQSTESIGTSVEVVPTGTGSLGTSTSLLEDTSTISTPTSTSSCGLGAALPVDIFACELDNLGEDVDDILDFTAIEPPKTLLKP
jgi:hypothetical protein